MKTYRSATGQERIWFEPSEIERIMESELRRASMMPTPTAPIVDVERFIERHLGAILDQYAALDASVLGVTEFFDGKSPRISINGDLTGSALDEENTAVGVHGRWRATLAHEAAHVVLHRSLYEFAHDNLDLFPENRSASAVEVQKLQRCLKRDASYRQVSDWREVQANQGMAALLMPKSLFSKIAREALALFFPDRDKIPGGREERVAAYVADKIKVSKQAARIRLSTLGFVAPVHQQHL
jgi:hypothetical protein